MKMKTITVSAFVVLGSIGSSVAFAQSNGSNAVTLYPFDSVENGEQAWSFSELQPEKGFVEGNDFYRFDPVQGVKRMDHASGTFNPSERILTDPADRGPVASGLAFNGAAATVAAFGEAVLGSYDEAAAAAREGGPESAVDAAVPLSVSLQGHLYLPMDSNVLVGDTIFVIEIVHMDDFDGDRPVVLDRVGVTKGQLLGDHDVRDVRAYRTVAAPTRVRLHDGESPLLSVTASEKEASPDAGNEVLRFDRGQIDIRVIWTGKERAAVRSVSVGADTL